MDIRWFSTCFVLIRKHSRRFAAVLQCKVLQKVLLQFSMRPARICLASVLCSHALLPPQRRITPRRRSTGSLKAYNELRALAGVAAAAKLGTREPCAALAAAAALASVKVLPRESIIYAWGWTVILPLSLALTLIGREASGMKDGAATRRVLGPRGYFAKIRASPGQSC